MYEVTAIFKNRNSSQTLSEEKLTVLTIDEDFEMPMCSIGNTNNIVLERGAEMTLQVQQFNPIQD
jgi:hypothetical protein